MKITAVICEFNPFHRGHEYILSCAREEAGEEGAVIAVMSGSFVQRGEGAVYPAHIRGRAAILCGADAVVELPFPWSCTAAPDFAFGACSIAKDLGAESIVFGSESADAPRLERTSERISTPEFERELAKRALENKGARYASLREELYSEFYGEPLVKSANDILAIEYMACLRGSSVKAIAKKRILTESASQIREKIYSGESNALEGVSAKAKDVFDSALCFDKRTYSAAVIGYLRLASIEPKGLYGLPDGLLERIRSLSAGYCDIDLLIEASATKKYTNAAIRRAVVHSVLNTHRENVKQKPAFTRLIGANQKGRQALSYANIPIVTRSADIKALSAEAKLQLEAVRRADMLYSLCDKNPESNAPFIL